MYEDFFVRPGFIDREEVDVLMENAVKNIGIFSFKKKKKIKEEIWNEYINLPKIKELWKIQDDCPHIFGGDSHLGGWVIKRCIICGFKEVDYCGIA